MFDISEIGKKAKAASYELVEINEKEKNNALKIIAQNLLDSTDIILNENKKDVENAKANGVADNMIDRLSLNEKRVADIAKGVEDVIALTDPVGRVIEKTLRPNGLEISKISVPMGVIGIIYEARPNVTVDAAVLCLKSSNCCILRGGKEAINTNLAFEKIMRSALKQAGLNSDCIQVIKDTSRQSAISLMQANEYVDVLIPRGGAGLIKSTVENATVPTIETGTGNCHIYVDDSADIEMALDILENAKTSRTSVCNACESLVIHKNVAKAFLPRAYDRLKKYNVEFFGCEKSIEIVGEINKATDEDYYREYLDYKLSVKITDDINSAIAHINECSTHHSETIVSENKQNIAKFLKCVDSACVYANASTRFTDGNEFGFGAEIGISTQKMHARGPMGLRELTTYKYIISGNGQIRK